MRSRLVVVFEVVTKQPFQMVLIEHDDMIEQFAAKRADHAFDVWILPRGMWRADDFLDTEVLNPASELIALNTIVIALQVARSRIEWKRLNNLLRRP